MHSVVPADFDLNAESNGKNFLEFPPDIQSGEDQVVRYYGIVKSLGPEGERTAVVRTMEGCDVDCSTLGCEGLERLRVAELVQIRHWKDGDNSQTYIEHTAAECTPSNTLDGSLVGSLAGSLVGSLVGSRAGSRAPTRPPTPAGS